MMFIYILCVLLFVWFLKWYFKMRKEKRETEAWEESRKPLNDEEIAFIRSKIPSLSKGMTMDEFLEIENSIKVRGTTEWYKNYGFFLIYNETKHIHSLRGIDDFDISTSLHMFFVTNEGRGNPYMHKHYVEGDKFLIRFIPFESDSYIEWRKREKEIEELLNKDGESYVDYIGRVGPMEKQIL